MLTFSDIATQQRQVPALGYTNPNPNGVPYVKFDGYSVLGDGTTELIDSKTRLVPFSTEDGPFISDSVRSGLLNKSAALSQNPGFTGVLEFPMQDAADEASLVLNELEIQNLMVRVRPPQPQPPLLQPVQ